MESVKESICRSSTPVHGPDWQYLPVLVASQDNCNDNNQLFSKFGNLSWKDNCLVQRILGALVTRTKRILPFRILLIFPCATMPSSSDMISTYVEFDTHWYFAVSMDDSRSVQREDFTLATTSRRIVTIESPHRLVISCPPTLAWFLTLVLSWLTRDPDPFVSG